jgi:hypothetical protein
MKKSIISIIIIFVFTSSALAFDFYFFGVNPEWIKERKWGQVFLGAVTSVVVHEGSHYLVGKVILGGDFEFRGTELWFERDFSESEKAWINRSGFVGQTIVGTVLNIIPATKGSDFALGFNTMTLIETATYPIRYRGNDGDIKWLEENSSTEQAYVEWGFYTGAAIFNTFWAINN